MKTPYAARIKKALALLARSGEKEALVISSNPHCTRSRDTHFPFRQNSDLYYFTGSYAEEATLVLNPHAKSPIIIIAPPKDPIKKVWDGEQVNLKPLAKSLSAELVITKDPLKALLGAVRGVEKAYLQSIQGTASAALKTELSGRSAIALRGLPSNLAEVERFTGQLRLYKDPSEVELIKAASELTSDALFAVLPFVRSGASERQIGAFIEGFYRAAGAEPAFGTIVGTGRSAATLHYRALKRTLRNGDLVLIDTGAEREMYASDVTRTLPVGDSLDPALRYLYETVLRAQEHAIAKIKPGVLVSDVYKAAAEELTYGLKELGILKGKLSALMAKAAYRPWFPHGIGHSLGIDVHDVGPSSADRVEKLEAGMVMTIEPGLYFSKPTGPLPACGVRIEDDVLVTRSGHKVLTEDVFPKELDEVMGLMGSISTGF
jgi:Xaa-Pro aminopeptidase